MGQFQKILVSDAKIEHYSTDTEIAKKYIKYCFFCNKECKITKEQDKLSENFSLNNEFYCNFCLQHNFHNKWNRDILLLSFKGIFGHFYYNDYLTLKSLWISQIEDFISTHAEVGLQNPVFLYDPESFIWFINFDKVGESKKRIPLKEVLKTIINILTTFNLAETTSIELSSLYFKYKNAIDSFYKKRHRPDQKILIPTIAYNNDTFERIKNFSIKDIKNC